ncbi:MAG: hypothetical protein ACTSQQ_09010, partial [Candidatus Helarchaeota archaeon]
VFRIIRDYQKVHQHPIIIILRQLLKPAESMALEKRFRRIRDKFQELQIPVYSSFYRGIRALANYLSYYQS